MNELNEQLSKEWYENKYETLHCEECKWLDKICNGKAVSDSTKFPEHLLEYFPTDNSQLYKVEKYFEPKVKIINPKIENNFIPVIWNKSDINLDTVLYPLSNFYLSRKVLKPVKEKFLNVKKVGLLLNAKDGVLHHTIFRSDFKDIILQHKFDFIITPSFSFYENQPACSTVYNRLLIYKFIYTMQDVPMIPWANYTFKKDGERFAEWLNKNNFEYAAFSMQDVKSFGMFLQYLKQLIYFMSIFKGKVLLIGMTNLDRLHYITKYKSRLIFSNSHLAVKSSNRTSWKSNKFIELDKDETLKVNIKTYWKELNKKLNLDSVNGNRKSNK